MPPSCPGWRCQCCGPSALCGICGERVAACLLSFTVSRRCGWRCLADALNGSFRCIGTCRCFRGLVAAVSRCDIARASCGAAGGRTTAVAGRAVTRSTIAAGTTRAALFLGAGLDDGRQVIAAQRVTLVDPDLDADDAIGGLGFGETVVDVGAQRMERHAAFAVPLGTRDFDAVQAA